MKHRNLKNALGIGLIVLWVPLVSATVALTYAPHLVAMQGVDAEDRLTEASRVMLGPGGGRVHLIPAGCSCTDALLTHLTSRGAKNREVVVLGGAMPESGHGLRAAGFVIQSQSVDQLEAQFGLGAAPVLAIVSASGKLAYAGGYFKDPSAIHALDVEIAEAVSRGENPDSLPVFGCAVSKNLREKTWFLDLLPSFTP